ncbi:MAG TPA: nucleotide exchange factor GrpE [archaeon]|nr:nucleotide exchange factor GrpE [archaeon]
MNDAYILPDQLSWSDIEDKGVRMSIIKDKGKKHKKDDLENRQEPAAIVQDSVELEAAALPEALPESFTEEAVEAIKAPRKRKPAELEALSAELAALDDKYKRLLAEYDNFKRRSAKEKLELAGLVKSLVFRDIIPVLDDFKRFFEHAGKNENSMDQSFIQGVELIYKAMLKALEKHGVETIDQVGVPVDYDLHEAVLTQPVEDRKEDQTVKQVLEVGYRIGDLIIRHAKVIVGVFKED